MVNSTQLFFTDGKKSFKNLFVICSLFFMILMGYGQNNPTPHNLSSSNYSFTGFAAGTTTIYPTSMQGWSFSAEPTTAITGSANANFSLSNNASGFNSGSIRNEIADGISLLNSSSNNIGAIVVSVNTTGRQDVTATWTAAEISANGTRSNSLVLQYRVGTTATWNTVSGTTYTTNTAATNTAAQTFSNIALPSGVNNQSVVQLRWLYYMAGGTTGTRDRIRLDDITVSSSAIVVAAPVVTGATVNGTVGSATNYQIVATNSPSSYAVSSGTLPAGLSLNLTSGVISGTPTTAGSSSVQVTATNGTGTSDPATLNFVIALGNQTITFNALTNRQYGDANFNLTATASSGLTVDYNSSNPLVATVSGNTVTIVGEGTTDITASQAGNANYNAAANVVRTLTITKRQLTVGGLTGDNKVYDATTTASANGTATLNNVLVGDESNVTLSGTPSFAYVTATVGTNKTINGSGFTLSGSAAGNYVLTQPTLTGNITAKTITVTGATANNKVYDGTTTATIVGGTLNGVEAIDVANVTLVSTGSFDTATVGENKPVTLSISGSAAFNYSLTQPGITASITKANQTITFNALPTLNTNSASVNLNTYASASSGLALTYESSNPTVVSVSGNTLSVVGAGTAIITASQDGNTNYNAAVDVTQNVTVNLAPSVIAGWDFSPITTSSSYGPSPYSATTSNPNVTVTGLTRGSGVTTAGSPAANAWGGNGWDTATSAETAVTNNDFVTFSITTNIGYSSSFESVESYNIRRSTNGPTTGLWQYQINSDPFVNIGSAITWGSTTTAAGNAQTAIDLSAISALQNLPPSTIVTFRVLNYSASNSTGNWYFNGQGGAPADLDFTITGYVAPVITEVTWNGTEWSNIAGPDETIDAIIAGDYVTGTHEEFTAKKVTVTSSGSLTVSSGTTITLVDVLENEATAADVVVENNANLIQSNDVDNIGSITVERNSSDVMRLDYTLWSSPVAGQNLLGFSPQTMANRFYVYNPSNNQYATITPSTNSFAEGTGYLIRSPDNHSTTPASWAGTFVGEPNNGDVTISVSNDTYNAVGNPYPSTISANAFITANGLTEAVYFWRKINGAAGSAYATYTFAGGAGTGSSNSNAQIPNGTIQVGQGFLVKATSGSLVFTNLMRTANHQNQFFRNADSDKNRIWLNISNAQNVVGQTLIAYMENTSVDYDAMYDGKYINDSQTAFTSLLNNEEYTVQARGLFAVTDVVPMHFKTEAAGSYTISLAHVDGLFENDEAIFVKDNLTGVEHNLTNSSYEFTSVAGSFGDRFEIIYQSTLGVSIPEFGNQTKVFAKDNRLNVQSGSVNITGIQVFDVQGRLVLDVKEINSVTYSTSLDQISSGVLLVKVTAENGQSTTKKIIK